MSLWKRDTGSCSFFRFDFRLSLSLIPWLCLAFAFGCFLISLADGGTSKDASQDNSKGFIETPGLSFKCLTLASLFDGSTFQEGDN